MNAAADRWNRRMEGRDSPLLIAVAAADMEVRRESLDDRIARELEEFRQPDGTLPQQEESQTAAAGATPSREVHSLPPVPRKLKDERRRSEGNVVGGPTEVEFTWPEQQSWEAERELREYLQGNSRPTSPVLQPPPAWLPVPSADRGLPPMDWDNEDVGSEAESLGVPTIVVNAREAPTVPGSRNKRKRAHTYNPSRQLEVDDYVAAHLRTPPRSPTPPSEPIRRPLSPRSRVRELDRQRRERNRELEREEASRVERESETPRGRDRETENRERVRERNGSRQSREGQHHESQRSSNPNQSSHSLPLRQRVKTRGIMFGGLTPIPIDPVLDPPPKVCYNCWQGGHSLLRCPRAAVRRFCHNCGRSGVDLFNCPRCREPHIAYKERQTREKEAATIRERERWEQNRRDREWEEEERRIQQQREQEQQEREWEEEERLLRERQEQEQVAREREEEELRARAQQEQEQKDREQREKEQSDRERRDWELFEAEQLARRGLMREHQARELARLATLQATAPPVQPAGVEPVGMMRALGRAPLADPLLAQISVGEALRLVEGLRQLLSAAEELARRGPNGEPPALSSH